MEIVSKVVGGSGISWPKPASLKRLSAFEKTRVFILRHLEERLGIRTSNDVVLSTSSQITPVVSILAVLHFFITPITCIKYLTDTILNGYKICRWKTPTFGRY